MRLSRWARFKKSCYLWKRSIKFWWQRRTRGWDDSDTWNLDISLSALIVPRLQKFKEITDCYSGDSEDEWKQQLAKMIRAFELCRDQFELPGDRSSHTPEETNEITEGLALFAKYYRGLWW